MQSVKNNRLLAALTALTFVVGAAGFGAIASAEEGGPTVALSSVTATTTNAAAIEVTATFSEAVNGLADADITVTNGTVMDFTGSDGDSEFTFSIDPTADGEVTVMIGEDVATSTDDDTGNVASNELTFTVDTAAPTITMVTDIASPSSSATPSFTIGSDEDGTLSFTGDCSATATDIVVGENEITLNELANGSYTCTVVVTDEAGNESNALDLDFEVAVEEEVDMPVISDVAVSDVTETSAVISWTTDVDADSQVMYGTSTAYGLSSDLDANASTTHAVLLEDLEEGTVYHFQVVSTNDGGTATSSDMTFVTLSTASSTPLELLETEAVDTDGIADGTWENGWHWVLTFTVPDNETSLQMRFTDFTDDDDHSFAADGNIRIYSEQSSNASSTEDAVVAEGNDYGDVVELTGDTDAGTPGRQVEMHVQVKIPFGTTPGENYATTFGVLTDTP